MECKKVIHSTTENSFLSKVWFELQIWFLCNIQSHFSKKKKKKNWQFLCPSSRIALIWSHCFFDSFQGKSWNYLVFRHVSFFIAMFTSLVSQTNISLILKIQLKQHHYLYTKFVYNSYNDAGKSSMLKGKGQGTLIIGKSTKVVEIH